MATEGETSYQGGAGGKFRKKSTRTDSKPYDRIPNSRRNNSDSLNPNANATSFSKRIVDSASRTISQNAQKLYSFVFRKNSPALPTILEANHESREAYPQGVLCNHSRDQDQLSDEGAEQNNNPNSSAIDDLENILKQKTFTRAEVDHLTELLRSRTSDVPAMDEKKRFETSTPQLAKGPAIEGNFQVQENEGKTQALLVTVPDPLGSSSLLEEDVASPTELAKAYMGRTSRVSPSTLSLRSQPYREDALLRTSLPFTPKSPSISFAPRTSLPYDSVPRGPENGFLTPVVPRGRSALYNMGRTPYSRVHHSVALKGVGPIPGEKAVLSTSSQRSWDNTLLSGGRQASKRRISVLESDIGSIGPLRRVRRKSNMTSPENTGLSVHRASSSIPSTPIGADAAKDYTPSVQKQLQLDGRTHNSSVRGPMECGESSKASKEFVCVPNQSRKTAQKILQQLDKIVPSPKGKSCELKAITETSPSKFMPGMLEGQALKSLDHVDSHKSLHGAHANGILDGLGDNHDSSAQNLTSEKQARVDHKGSIASTISEDKLGSEANGTTRSTKDASSFKFANAFTSCSVANVPQKKHTCEENAKKDLEHEENNLCTGAGSNSLVAGKGKHDRLLGENREIADGAVTVGDYLCSTSDVGTSEIFKLKRSGDTQDSEKHPASDIGLTYPMANDASTVAKPAPSASLFPSFKRTPSSSETTGAVFSFSSKSVDKGAQSTFFSASRSLETSGVNGTQSEAKPEISCSAAAPRSGESSSTSASTTSGIFSFGASSSPSLSNGSAASSTSLFTVPASVLVSDITTTTATPVFKFGSDTSGSAALFTSVSKAPETSAIESNSAEDKTNSTSLFGSFNNPSFGKINTFTGSSSSTFAFGASISSSANLPSFSNQIQGSNVLAASSGSAPVTVSTTFTQTMPSASSQTFGLSGTPAFGTGGSPFGSSPGTKFGSQCGPAFTTEGFKFGSPSTVGSAPTAFGSSLGTPSGSIFSVTSAAAVSSSPLSSSSPGNDQMMVEDSMSERAVQASTPMNQGFGLAPSSTQPSVFAFGATSSGPSTMFQFGSQQDPTTSQHQTPIQATGSIGSSAGGSFSLGIGGGDKSNRRFFKAKRDKSRKK